jgi:hypothetical protein
MNIYHAQALEVNLSESVLNNARSRRFLKHAHKAKNNNLIFKRTMKSTPKQNKIIQSFVIDVLWD